MDHVFIMMKVTEMNLESAMIQEISMLRTDDKGNQIVAMTQDNIRQDKHYLNDIASAIDEFRGMLNDQFMFISYFGEAFYKPLLRKTCEYAKVVESPIEGHSWIGIEQLAWPLAFDGALKDRKLETLAKHLGVFSSDKLWIIHQCYWTLMRRITTGILFEDKARSKGGRFFEVAQQFVRRF